MTSAVVRGAGNGPSAMTLQLPRTRRVVAAGEDCADVDAADGGACRMPQVNWGHGRLARFSSQVSLTAQFCMLNDVRPRLFKAFFARYLQRPEEPWWTFKEADLLPLADLLDEPFETVRTLSPDAFRLPPCYGAFKYDFSNAALKHRFSYCPSCLRNGYHAAFHEAPWLYECPIHRVPLHRPQFLGGYSEYVAVAAASLRDACPRWPDVLAHEALPAGSEGTALTELCAWLAVVQRRAALLRAQDLRGLDEPPYRFQHLGVLLGRLATLAPVSDALAALFLVPPCHEEQAVEPLSRDAARSLAAIARKIPLDEVLRYYVMTAARHEQPRRFRRLAAAGIERLRQAHEVCCCQWKWDRYDGWSAAYPGQIQHAYYLCPYAYAMKELADWWLAFCPTDLPRRTVVQARLHYAQDSQEWVDLGLAEYVDAPAPDAPRVDPFSPFRLPRLCLPDDVDAACDAVLAHQVAAHCEELSLWLASITPETPPLREERPGNVNVFVAEDAAWISAWTPGAGASTTDPLRRWYAGERRTLRGTRAPRWPRVALAQ